MICVVPKIVLKLSRVEIVFFFLKIQEIGCVTFSCGSLAQFGASVNDMRISLGRKSTNFVRVARDGATGRGFGLNLRSTVSSD